MAVAYERCSALDQRCTQSCTCFSLPCCRMSKYGHEKRHANVAHLVSQTETYVRIAKCNSTMCLGNAKARPATQCAHPIWRVPAQIAKKEGTFLDLVLMYSRRRKIDPVYISLALDLWRVTDPRKYVRVRGEHSVSGSSDSRCVPLPGHLDAIHEWNQQNPLPCLNGWDGSTCKIYCEWNIPSLGHTQAPQNKLPNMPFQCAK